MPFPAIAMAQRFRCRAVEIHRDPEHTPGGAAILAPITP
jgi:hypothetical protein